MTRDTDPTPPHGITRPAPIQYARWFIADSLTDCADWEYHEDGDAHPDRAPLNTLSNALDILEMLVTAYGIGDSLLLDSLIASAATEVLGRTYCARCGYFTEADTEGLCGECHGEDEDEDDSAEPARCDGCNRTPAFPSHDRYTLCQRCADQLTEERSRPQFPDRPDLGAGLLTAEDDTPSPFGSALDD